MKITRVLGADGIFEDIPYEIGDSDPYSPRWSAIVGKNKRPIGYHMKQPVRFNITEFLKCRICKSLLSRQEAEKYNFCCNECHNDDLCPKCMKEPRCCFYVYDSQIRYLCEHCSLGPFEYSTARELIDDLFYDPTEYKTCSLIKRGEYLYKVEGTIREYDFSSMWKENEMITINSISIPVALFRQISPVFNDMIESTVNGERLDNPMIEGICKILLSGMLDIREYDIWALVKMADELLLSSLRDNLIDITKNFPEYDILYSLQHIPKFKSIMKRWTTFIETKTLTDAELLDALDFVTSLKTIVAVAILIQKIDVIVDVPRFTEIIGRLDLGKLDRTTVSTPCFFRNYPRPEELGKYIRGF